VTAEDPLWTRHDRAGQAGDRLSSHGFVKNLKAYARLAGLDDIHLHRTRHTYARMVGELKGSVVQTQDALGHRNAATTRVVPTITLSLTAAGVNSRRNLRVSASKSGRRRPSRDPPVPPPRQLRHHAGISLA
jgi:integrase